MADPYVVWEQLSSVERTALQTAWCRGEAQDLLRGPDAPPLYDASLDRMLVGKLMPAPIKEKHGQTLTPHLLKWMVLRTAVIDAEAMHAVSSLSIHQVVILGAGLDLRAWRLPWLQDTTVFEVDSGTVETFKSESLLGVPAKSASCRRVFVQADVADANQLRTALEGAGLDAEQRTLWLLEGLVGYLTVSKSLDLFKGILGMSAAGSCVVMTTPPTLESKEDAERQGMPLHHTTFEQPEVTLARFVESGWAGRLLDLGAAGPTCGDVGPTWKQLLGDAVDDRLRFIIGSK